VIPPLAEIQAEIRRRARRKIDRYYPDEGEFRRELYAKHLEFFAAGLDYRERLFIAANRVGKTEGVGAYETTLHLTGRYPDWWRGRRFDYPIDAWAAGDTGDTVRDIIQLKLLGPSHEYGTGMIPGDLIRHIAAKRGNAKKPEEQKAEMVETIYVRHISGGTSKLGLKSYDQGRRTFQGTEKDLIWLDEECPLDVYTECLIRTMTTEGLILLTFTPLKGLTELVQQFLPNGLAA